MRALGLALLLALVPAARAQDAVLGVSGKDVAGTASLQGDRVVLSLRRFSKDGSQTRRLEGRVVERGPGGLRFSYEKRVPNPGLADRLAFWRTAPTKVEQVEVRLTKDAAGALAGTVEGLPQRWVAQPDASGLVVLVVPGLSTNLWNQYGVPYLDENLATLRARGFEARRLEINTEASIAENAAHIAKDVRTEVARGKKVVLLAHSKGGADTVTALSDPANRDLLPHVAAFLAIQPVYAGSPIADLVGSSCLIQGTVDQFFERALPAINRETDTGSRDAVQDLRSERRQALLRERPFPVDRVPTIVLRGHFSGRPMWRPRHVLRKPLWVFQKFLERQKGIASDGMVALEWQRIPGAKAELTLDDIDHFEPGFRGESPYPPCDVTNRLLDAALPHVRR